MRTLVLCTAFAISAGAQVASPAVPGGFHDEHEKGGTNAWATVWGRRWVEKDGALTTLSPDQTQVTGGAKSGFILSEYPSADNGTYEATLKLDQWNGNAGGMVVRWASPTSYYFISLMPGNEWSSKLRFHVNNMNESQGRVVAQNFKVGTTARLKVVLAGATIKIYVDDVLRATVNDSAHPYGRVGFGYNENWNNYMSVLSSNWVDAVGSSPSFPVDPRSGRVELKVHVLDEAFGRNNEIKPRLYIENTGDVTVSEFDAYYIFTAEPGKQPVFEDYYTPESTATLLPLGNNQYAIEYHFSGFDLPPGATTPDPNGNVTSVHYSDWSAMDKTNDYSNTTVATRQVSTKIPVEGMFPANAEFVRSSGEPLAYRTAGGTIPTTRKKMKRLKLERLRCGYETADDYVVGWDNVVVSVWLDGQSVKLIDAGEMEDRGQQGERPRRNYLFDENGGHDNDYLEFDSSARIELFDIESLDFLGLNVRALTANTTDYIGGNNLDVSVGTGKLSRFTRDGDYQLYYSVEEFEVDAKFPTLAEYQLDRFENSTDPGLWAYINKKDLVADMARRMQQPGTKYGSTYSDGPESIWQGKLHYCGAAAVTHNLIKKRPLRFVIFLREMYERGVFQSGMSTYRASSNLRKCKVPSDMVFDNDVSLYREITPATWMAMASIADGLDWAGKIYPDANEYPTMFSWGRALDGATPSAMHLWTQTILGFPYTDFDSSFVGGEESILTGAARTLRHGGVAFLLVDAALLIDESPWINFPDHWISFEGNLDITSGDWLEIDDEIYKFKYWSWAKYVDLELDEGELEDALWGAVNGE